MNTYKSFKKLFIKIICIVFSFITVISSVQNDFAVRALTPTIKLDTSDVLSDLRSDSSFNLNNYPYNENSELQLLSFNEYCYSFYSNLQANYGLYIYIYNPQCLEIVENSTLNKIQIAVAYDENGNPAEYEKFRLIFCSVSTEPNYYRLFYKFKIANADRILSRLNSNERRYDISGIELYSEGNTNAIDYGISRTFYYTGYAAGYGPDKSVSTLTCRTEKLETVELEVEHTFWRSLTSSKGAGYQNQLDTVYFTVPDYFFENYGKLQRIKAEWYEYKTKDIIVTSNQEFYNKAKNYVGQAVESYNSDIGLSIVEDLEKHQGGIYTGNWSWNLDKSTSTYWHIPSESIIYYLFPTKNWCDIKQYDPYANEKTIGGISTNDLYDYILNYNKTYNSGTVKGGTISADLFESDIDDYRKIDNEYGKIQQGYSYYDFDADVDLFDLLAYNPSDNDFTHNMEMYGFWEALFHNYGTIEQSFTGITPILVLDKDEYLSGNNQDISDRLLVNYNDVNKIKALSKTAKKEKSKVVLFRFAVTDYYNADVDIVDYGWHDEITGHQAYRAKESVFLDFDIIQLTFNKNGVYKVIPVVASPIDIVDAITPPYTPKKDGKPWWWYVIIVLAIIFALFILILFLPHILKGLLYLIKYLFIGVYYVLASPFYLIRHIAGRRK